MKLEETKAELAKEREAFCSLICSTLLDTTIVENLTLLKWAQNQARTYKANIDRICRKYERANPD